MRNSQNHRNIYCKELGHYLHYNAKHILPLVTGARNFCLQAVFGTETENGGDMSTN